MEVSLEPIEMKVVKDNRRNVLTEKDIEIMKAEQEVLKAGMRAYEVESQEQRNKARAEAAEKAKKIRELKLAKILDTYDGHAKPIQKSEGSGSGGNSP